MQSFQYVVDGKMVAESVLSDEKIYAAEQFIKTQVDHSGKPIYDNIGELAGVTLQTGLFSDLVKRFPQPGGDVATTKEALAKAQAAYDEAVQKAVAG